MTKQHNHGNKQEEFTVEAFRPRDAAAVAALFRSVYGEGYSVKLVYNPDQLIRALETGDNVPLVARTTGGDLIAYEAFYRSSPNPRLYELGQGLIYPQYRNLGIINHMNRFACDVMAPAMEMDAVFGEAVCNHTYMQRSWAACGAIVTALEVDLMPAEAYTKEGSASGRVAAVPGFRTFHSRHHEIYVTPRYEEAVRSIYARWDDERTFTKSESEPPEGVHTNIEARIFDAAQIARLTVHQEGRDFLTAFDTQEKTLMDSGIIVVQVWLNLSRPWVGNIVELLRSKGYFFGGVLPRWFDTDGMLMQKTTLTPNWEGIKLYEDSAKELMTSVRADWQAVRHDVSS